MKLFTELAKNVAEVVGATSSEGTVVHCLRLAIGDGTKFDASDPGEWTP